MANLLTCNGVNVGEPGEAVDLLGVAEVHGRRVFVYVELNELELQHAEAEGLTLEAETLLGKPAKLLLREFEPGRGQWLDGKLIWDVRDFPQGHWRLVLRIAGSESADRFVSIGEW